MVTKTLKAVNMIAMGWIAFRNKKYSNNYNCKPDGGVSCINGFFVPFLIAICILKYQGVFWYYHK
jgi:hypothetical protein